MLDTLKDSLDFRPRRGEERGGGGGASGGYLG